ncbi:hypothetical protein BGX24_006990, partial [Mortierella sp. AD032]
MFTIWSTYCALGDGESLESEELRWKLVHAFKARAKIELSRAYNKTLRAAQRPRSQDASDGVDPVRAAIKIWHHPPFVKMTEDGVSRGTSFSRFEAWGESMGGG